MLIPSIDCKLHKRCPRFEWIPFCPGHAQCKPYEGFKMYIAGEMWQNLKQFFFKECMITEQWKRVMLHNQTHKLVHSSAMSCQNLIIIHECSKKLLNMKNSKKFFLTPSTFGKVSTRFRRNIERKKIQLKAIECCTGHFLTDTSLLFKR